MLMGFMLPMKTKMTKDPNTSTRLSRVIYFSITTGLCGSITSFSTWSMQANKNFLLQWDGTWGNVASSFNGGRLFEYFISMWIGVVLPLSALQLGRYIHEHYAKGVIDKYGNVELSACSKVFVEVCIVLGFIVATILVIVIPIAVEPSWSYLCYTAGNVTDLLICLL